MATRIPPPTTTTQTAPLTLAALATTVQTTPSAVQITPTPTIVKSGITISFSEVAKGWTSFKSFIQDGGLSLNNDYYTFKQGELWKHHFNETRNNFYNNQYNSHVDILFNEESAMVKSFASMKYEGSQAKITQNLGDEEYYNNENTSTIAGFLGKQGWYVESGITDLQSAGEMEFKDKEGKWFSYMKGVPVETVADLESEEFSFQGIDVLQSTTINNNQIVVVGDCNISLSPLWLVDVVNGGLELNPGISAVDLPHTYTVTDANSIIYPNTSGPNPNPGSIYTRWVNLPPGQFTFEVLSASGCTELQSFTISQSSTSNWHIWENCNTGLQISFSETGTTGYPTSSIGSQTNFDYISNNIGILSTGDVLTFDTNSGFSTTNPLWPQFSQLTPCWEYIGTGTSPGSGGVMGVTSTQVSSWNYFSGLDSCELCEVSINPISGCMDPCYAEYDPSATIDNGGCITPAGQTPGTICDGTGLACPPNWIITWTATTPGSYSLNIEVPSSGNLFFPPYTFDLYKALSSGGGLVGSSSALSPGSSYTWNNLDSQIYTYIAHTNNQSCIANSDYTSFANPYPI